MKKIILILSITILSYYSFSQVKVLSSGTLDMGGNVITNSSRLDVSANDYYTIWSQATHSFGGGDAIKSQINRSDGFTYSGWYNNTRTFAVKGNGDVWSSTNYYSSDSILKSNIEDVTEPLQVIKKLRGVTYFMKDDEKKNKTKHAGLLAQEVEKVLPNIVSETNEGIKGIAYIELIPYLIEAIKLQQQKIEELEDCCNNEDGLKKATLNNYSNEVAFLDQNNPNPFNEKTTIKCYIPETSISAILYIFDMQGAVQKQFPINEKGSQLVIVDGNSLNPGMYLYTLVVDGREIDTRKMILTN